MILRITDNPMVEENPLIGAIPELIILPDRIIRWIVLMYDYESPYRKFPHDERMHRVASRLMFKKESDGKRWGKDTRDLFAMKDPRVVTAIEAYKDTQYDEDKEMLVSLRALISNIRSQIGSPTTDVKLLETRAKLANMLPGLANSKKDLIKILEITEEQSDDISDDKVAEEKMSTLEAVNEGMIEI